MSGVSVLSSTPASIVIDSAPFSASEVLRINGDTSIADAKGLSTITVNGAVSVSGIQRRFGFGSVLYGGSDTAYLSIPNSSIFDFGTGDFTIEAHVYCTGKASNGGAILGRWGSSGLNWLLLIDNTSGPRFYWNGAGNTITQAVAFPLNEWRHVAVCRSGTNIRLFNNGVQVASSTSIGSGAINYTAGQVLMTSHWNTSANTWFAGNIDDLVVTKAAKYTANFPYPQATDAPQTYQRTSM